MDYLVIGAGPAGLQLGYFLERAGRDYLVVEAGPAPGTFFNRFPRHRRLISINKPHTGWDDPELNLRMDWNSLLSDDPRLRFTRYTGRYLPDADGLRLFEVLCRQPLQLRNTVDDVRELLPKLGLELLFSDLRVLENVVQDRRRYGR